MDRNIETIPADAMEALTRWHWPGNIRELENLVERGVIVSSGPVLRLPLAELSEADVLPAPAASPSTRPAVPPPPPDALPAPPPAAGTLEATEREHILRVLRETKGVIAGPQGAAARLGLKRTTLNFKMKKLGITRDDI